MTRSRPLTNVDQVIWLVLTCVGLITLFVRRRWRLALLLLMPFAAVMAVNALGHWPEGVFRTNLFYVAYTAAIAAMAFESPGSGVISWSAVVPAVVLVVAPLLLFDSDLGCSQEGVLQRHGYAGGIQEARGAGRSSASRGKVP